VPSQEKKEKVKKIKKWFEKADSLLVLQYKGLKVSEATELRTQVSGLNAELRVLKNTLTRLALADTPKEGLVPLLDGPVAVVFVNEDPVPVARAIRDFARGRQEFYLLGGMIEGRILNGAQVESVAILPPREVLLAQMAGVIQAPLSGFLSLVVAPLRKTLGLFRALAAAAPEAVAPKAQQADAAKPQQAEVAQDELNADTAAAAKPQQAGADATELNADVKVVEPEAPQQAPAEPAQQADDNEAPEAQQADAEQVELNAETEATETSSNDKSQENTKDQDTN